MKRTRTADIAGVLVATLLASVWLLAVIALFNVAGAATPAHSNVVVPQVPPLWRMQLEREVVRRFGVRANIATVAAQIHQESRWRPQVASVYAQGLAQFTPPTAQWLPSVCPDVGKPDPWDPNWSLRAIACYDAWLYVRVSGRTECDRWAFTLSAYNGGLAWIARDKDRASSKGLDPARWFGHVERTTPRGANATVENRGYVQRILRVIEPAYLAAGWPGKAVCT